MSQVRMPRARGIARQTTSYNYYGPSQSTPAIARVFTNPALLEQIILQLDALFDGGGPTKRDRNQALLWAAQTCKTFFEPAVNVLWGTLSSLSPLLGVLPQVKRLGKYYTLVGQISDENWSRFDMYSRRVRVFKCEKLQDAVGNDVYIQIARLHPKPLFPLLREMEISTISDDFAEHSVPLFHCLSPNLTSVTIRNIEGERAEALVTSFISALSCESFGLRNLSIDGRISREAIDCLANIRGLDTLKLFINHPTPQANIEKLMGPLVTLRLNLILEFGQKGMVMKDHRGENGIFMRFNAALCIRGTNEQINQNFNLLPLSDGLECIKLEILHPPTTITLAPWRRMPDSLSVLTIKAHVIEGKLPVMSLNNLKLVDPSELEVLHMKHLSLRATHDDFLDVFGSRQWKNLVHLDLPCFGDRASPCSPSVKILGEIRHWCPNLRGLMIYVDLRLSDEKDIKKALYSMKASSSKHIHNLSGLDIQSIAPPKHHDLHQAILLAKYISALFPELSRLGAYNTSDEYQKDYWAGIWEAIEWSQQTMYWEE